MIGYLQVLGAVSIWAFFNGVLVKGIKTSGVGVGMWTGIFGAFFCLIGIEGNLGPVSPAQLLGLAGCLLAFFGFMERHVQYPASYSNLHYWDVYCYSFSALYA